MATSRIPWLSLLIAATLWAVTVGLYWPVQEQEFVSFDDTRYVIENRAIHRGIDAATVRWAFTTDRMGTWHPLTWLSHAADWSLYGSDAGGHHLSSLLLHALNVVLLFGVLRSMTGAVWASAFVALVFAVHPLNVASVAWVASRKGVLSTTFWLLTIGAYARYSKSGGTGRYLLVLAAFALGLMSKPMLVSLPLVLLLLDVWPLKRLGWSGEAAGDVRPLLEKIPLFAMAAGVSVVVFLVRRAGDPVPWMERWAQVPIAYVVYLRRLFWPAGLATPYPPMAPATIGSVAVALFVLLGISALAIHQRQKRPALAVGWLWFLLTLVPVMGFVQIGAHPMADRWTYVPMIGILVMLAWGLPSLRSDARAARVALATIGTVSVLALMVVTHAQIQTWQNTETLFVRALAVTENNRVAHYNLAWYFAKEKRVEEALMHYRRAIEIDPDHFPSQHNLGLLLIQEGRNEEAKDAICAALRLADPDDEALQKRLREHLGDSTCP